MELWDLYDKQRHPLGKTAVRGEKIPDGCFRLVITVCIFDKSGRMLIQRRHPEKYGWGGLWDISVGGSVISGEDSSQAAERELYEELGLRFPIKGERPKVSFSFREGFIDTFLLVTDEIPLGSLTLQPEEVVDARYATREEIHSLIDLGEFIPYDKSVIDLVFFMKDTDMLQRE